MTDVFTEDRGWCEKLEGEVLSGGQVRPVLAEHFIPVSLGAETSPSRVRIGSHASASPRAW